MVTVVKRPRSISEMLGQTLADQSQRAMNIFPSIEKSKQQQKQNVLLEKLGLPTGIAELPESIQREVVKKYLGAQQQGQQDEAYGQLLREAGWPEDRIKRHMALNPKQRSLEIESLKEKRGWIESAFHGPAPHPVAPRAGIMGMGGEASQGNIQDVVQQLRQAGMADEEISQKLNQLQTEEQQEQQPFDWQRMLGGAVTGGLGAGAMRLATNAIPLLKAPLLAKALDDIGVTKNVQEIAGRGAQDAARMAEDFIEKRTGERPKITPSEIPKPPLAGALKYAGMDTVTNGIRDIAEKLGFKAKPHTYGEKKGAGIGEAIGWLFDPKRAATEGIANALKVSGIQGVGAHGLGALGKIVTGSDLVDNGMTMLGYILANRYPGKLQEYKSDQFNKWDKALAEKGGTKENIPRKIVSEDINKLDKQLQKADYIAPHKKFLYDKVIAPIHRAARGDKYSADDLYDLRKGLTKQAIYDDVQKFQVNHEYKQAKKAIDKGIDWWGKRNAPDALESLRTANGIHSTTTNTNIVADSIRKLAGGGMLSASLKRMAFKLFARPTAAVLDEALGVMTSPAMRKAYYNIINEGAKKNPEALAAAITTFGKALKKKDSSLYERLTSD